MRWLFVLMVGLVGAAGLSAPAPSPTSPKTIINSIGMKLVRIPPGKFKMGSPEKEVDRAEEETQYDVEITKEFWLGIHEVTQKQFKDVMGYNPSFFSRDGRGQRRGNYVKNSKPAGGKDRVGVMDTSNFPVENVSWEEASEFCRKLTERAAERGRKYRLPTEAEWEYACRGGAPSYQVFHIGDSLCSKQANFVGDYPYGGADKGVDLQRTCKVGSYEKNRFGLYDMHGNVAEWCQDGYSPDYYRKSPLKDPLGPVKVAFGLVRGGGWCTMGKHCRAAYRCRVPLGFPYLYLGFRVALVSSVK